MDDHGRRRSALHVGAEEADVGKFQRVLNVRRRRGGFFLHRQGFAGEGRTISPGTSILSDTSPSLPLRTTVAVLLTIAWSFSAALSARISWTKRNTTPRTTITKMTTVARRSPVRKEIMPSARSRRTNGFLMLPKRRISAD